ncbi:MAG TPA: hypothetical protein DCE56_15780 [Cyanobacteria bacterium UBA8553]|nr:hypothetical protein [Cyanobacteria bacterium UBA8553]HAJ59651.1 hypothetical protein [Cyanobacteria bacterium UBA8543]
MLKFTRYVTAVSLVLLTVTTGCSHLEQLQGKSSASKVALAKHLKQSGVVLYGSPWCPSCNVLKKTFGKEAFKQLNYIECEGNNGRPELCQKANITRIPAWEIKGRQYLGISLQELADLSDYKGDRNF